MIFIIVSNSSYKWIRQVTDAEEIFANCRSDMTYIHFFFNSQNSIIRKQQPNSKHRQNICCGWIWNAAHRLTANVDSPAGGVIHGGQGGVTRGGLTQFWSPGREHPLPVHLRHCTPIMPSSAWWTETYETRSQDKLFLPGDLFFMTLFWSNWLKKITSIMIKQELHKNYKDGKLTCQNIQPY